MLYKTYCIMFTYFQLIYNNDKLVIYILNIFMWLSIILFLFEQTSYKIDSSDVLNISVRKTTQYIII